MWDVGQENVRKNRRMVTKEVGKEVNLGRKNERFPRKRGERQPRFQCFFERHASLLGFADFVNNVVRCWKKHGS